MAQHTYASTRRDERSLECGTVLAGCSSQGDSRLNRDRFRVERRGVVVCDGNGGLQAGELFAEMAAWKVAERLGRGDRADKALGEAGMVLARFKLDNRIEGGASGSVGSYNVDGSWSICSRGNVRAFVVGRDLIRPIGDPDIDGRGRLTSYLGQALEGHWRPAETLEASELEGAVLLFASDGVWKYLSERDMASICHAGRSAPEDVAVELVKQAKCCKSPDDCTAVVCYPNVFT